MSNSDYTVFMPSACTASDSGSNWSQPQREVRRRIRRAPIRRTKQQPKSLQRTAMCRERGLKQCKAIAGDGTPGLWLKRYRVRLTAAHGDMVGSLLEEINEEAMVVQALYPLYEEATKRLEVEVLTLKQRVMELEAEAVEIKRNRWCSLCLNEAAYVRNNRFFCSKHCEIQYVQQAKDIQY